MKQRMVLSTILVVELLVPVGLLAQGEGVKPHSNPKPFQNFLAPVSAPVSFLASDRGRALLRKSPTSNAISILKALGEDVSGLTPISPPKQFPRTPARVGTGTLATLTGTPCGTTTGSRFDSFEEPAGARPQNEESVDFLLNRVHTSPAKDLVVMGANDYRGLIFDPSLPFLDGGTGYYVSRGDPCSDDFEGALPPIEDPLSPGDFVLGGGDPVVAADPGRDSFFMADLRFSGFSTSIGLSRSIAANLLSTANCPNGLHTTAVSERCWPKQILVNTLPLPFGLYLQDKPSMTVDERGSETGAGNVYVAATEFDLGFSSTSRIWLVSCNNALTACSSPLIISGTDTAAQFSDVRVRPTSGIVTVTYVNASSAGLDVKYVSCNPAAAPASPSCSPAVTVANETQPLFVLGAEDFRIATYPTHDHRTDTNGTETYVAWSRCKVPAVLGSACPDADVVIKASKNNGATWSARALVNPGASADDQFFPWVKTDRSRNVVNILYYDNHADSGLQHRVQVKLAQIFPGSATPDVIKQTNTLTTTLNEPDGDPFLGGFFFGDYIGVAARGTGAAGGSHAHVGYTANHFLGSYGTNVAAPQQDNWHNQINY